MRGVARPHSRVFSLARMLFLVWNKFRDVENKQHTRRKFKEPPPGNGRYVAVVINSAYMYIVLIRWLTCLDVAYQCVLYILIGKSAR